LRTNKAII